MMKTFVLVLALATVPAAATEAPEWKTAEGKLPPYLSGGRILYAYVNNDLEDAALALTCQIEPSVPSTFLDLTVRIGRTEDLGQDDRRATLNVRFGDEKREFSLPGLYVDHDTIKEVSGWGDELAPVVRRLQSSEDADSLAVRVVLAGGQALRAVTFPLTGAKEAVAFMSGCGGIVE